MPRYLATVFTTLALTVIGGCGQMGPLYMPSEEPRPAAPDAANVRGDAGAVSRAE